MLREQTGNNFAWFLQKMNNIHSELIPPKLDDNNINYNLI